MSEPDKTKETTPGPSPPSASGEPLIPPLQGVVERLPEGVFIHGTHGTEYANPALCEMLSVSPHVCLNPPIDWLSALEPADGDRIAGLLDKLVADGNRGTEPLEMTLSLPKRPTHALSLTLSPLDTTESRVMGLLRDSAPQDPVQLALYRRSELLQAIADATHLLIALDVREREVVASMELLRQATRADRVCIAVTEGPPLTAGTPLQARCVGVDGRTSTFDLPVRWRRILAGHSAIHEDVSNLPAGERQALSAEGVRWILSLPVVSDGVPRGHIRFDRMTSAHGWTTDEIVALQAAANGYGVALARVETLTELRSSEARYRRLVENAPDFIYRMSLPDGAYEYASPAAEQMLGHSAASILEHPVLVRETIHPGWRGYFEAEWEKLRRGEAPPTYEYAVIHGKTGETRWLFQRNVLIRDEAGDVIAIEGIVSDITARKRAELRLKTQQSLLESIFRGAPVGIAVASDRVILQINEKISEMTGYESRELVGGSSRILYPTERDFDRAGQIAYGDLQQGGASTIESRWLRKDGTMVDVLLNVVPLDPADLAAGILVTALDITQRKRNEAGLRASLREKETLLQEVHHRVKNSLAVVSGMLGLQALQIGDPALSAALEASRDRIHAMARVYEHLYRSPDLGSIAMAPYIRQLANELKATYGSNVHFDIEADDVCLSIRQATPCGLILNELITNALKHAFPAGATTDEPPRIRIDLKTDEGRCIMQVSDNGIGRSQADGTEKPDSLGLYLVELLSSQLGTTIQRSPGVATRFDMTFDTKPTEGLGNAPFQTEVNGEG